MGASAALELIEAWPVDHCAAAIVDPNAVQPITVGGATEHRFRLASLSKPMAAWAIMVGVEEGIIALDDEVPHDLDNSSELHPATTLRHLLAHASGLPFEGARPIAGLAQRRIYSNTGIEIAASMLQRTAEMPFGEYLAAAVFEPLQMSASELVGSPAHGVHSTAADVARFVVELLRPRVLANETATKVVSVQYRDLAGIVPGVGNFDPCPWGLGIEIKGDKSPHWMGDRNSPATAGHFGGAGTMMWADPVADCGAVALTDRGFDQWAPEAMRAWEKFSNQVIEEVGS